MANRKLLPITELPIIGGALCLDLVNTTGARQSESPRERLFDYADLLVWAGRAGVLEPKDLTLLGDAAFERPFGAKIALQRARELREDIYRVFRPIADGEEPLPADLERITAWWRADQSRRKLVALEGRFSLRIQTAENELDAMLWPVVSSAVELLTSYRLARVKRCGECDWLFIDESKNGTRMWCKKDCGDRARVRRHYYKLPRNAASD